MSMLKQIIISIIVLSAIYLIIGNWNEISVKANNIFVSSKNLIENNPAKQKCTQSSNDKISFFNQKYNPIIVFSLIEVKEFNTTDGANSYVNLWGSSHQALDDIKNANIFPIYIARMKLVSSGNGAYLAGTIMNFLVCDTNGIIMSNTDTLK